jgi:phage repressor protein C with HTH and peptisase S24 domain
MKVLSCLRKSMDFSDWVKSEAVSVGSANVLAKKMGVSRSTIGNWMDGAVVLRDDTLKHVAKYLNQSVEETAVKFNLKNFSAEQSKKSQEIRLKSNVVNYDAFETVLIPMLDLRAGAGNGCIPDTEHSGTYITFPKIWFKQNFHSDPKFVNAIIVSGDSMSPTVDNGDLVMIDRQDTRITQSIYVIALDGDIYVKRLSKTGNKIQIISDNTAYPSQEIACDYDNFQVCGKVIYFGKKS